MFFKERIKVEVKGLNLNVLLKSLEESGVVLNEVKRPSHDKLEFVMRGKDFRFLRREKFFEKYDVTTSEIKSVESFLFSLPVRAGLLAGFIACAIIISIFSSTLFSVEVRSSDGNVELEQSISTYLSENGVRSGASSRNINVRDIQNDIFVNFVDVSVAIVKKQGVRLIVEVEPAVLPSREEHEILAERDGIIESIVIFEGIACVREGDVVKAGDVLVKAGEAGFCSANIMTRVWVNASVAVESYVVSFERTGVFSETREGFLFGKQVFFKGKQKEFEFFEVEKKDSFAFNGLFLPLRVTYERIFELEKIEEQKDLETAKKEAEQKAENLARALLPKDSNVLDVRFFVREVEGDLIVDCVIEVLSVI